jgi:GTP-binding protein
VERTTILLHLVDVSGMVPGDPVDNFKKINNELKLYSKDLTKKYMAVAATKIDAAIQEHLEKLETHCRKAGLEFFPISSVTGEGMERLVRFLADKVEEGKKEKEPEARSQKPEVRIG